MQQQSTNQKGFAAVEALLVVLILGLIGFVGWYVWHAKDAADKTLNAAASSHNSVSKTTGASGDLALKSPTTKVLTIKEWNVKAVYSSNDMFSVHVDKETDMPYGYVGSSILGHKYGGDCAFSGAGNVLVATANDAVPGDMTAAQFASKFPESVGHVGEYYYIFQHSQAACSNNSSQQAATDQNKANAEVKAMVHNLQPLQ